MKRLFRPWIQLLIIMSILAALLPANMAHAATPKITSLYVTTNLTNGKPTNDDAIPRVTSDTINVLATIEGITDSQLESFFPEVTNVTRNISVPENAITAQKVGSFDVRFNNVPLTEGLNKIVIRQDGSSTVESSPGWVYYTPSTSIATLKIDGESYREDRFYPANPDANSVINIELQAPNATELQAYLYGAVTPVNGIPFGQNGFFFIGDDANKNSATATMQLNPGDNPIDFFAINPSRSYKISRNIIYDNGKPFAFDAKINDGSGDQLLVTKPVVTQPSVQVSALLKVDLNAFNQPEYRYVDIVSGSKRFGPFDLGGAESAENGTVSFSNKVYEDHSDLEAVVSGTSLNAVRMFIQNVAGTIPRMELDEEYLSANGTLKTFMIDDVELTLTKADSPYKLTATDAAGTRVLSEYTFTVEDPGAITIPKVDSITIDANLREEETHLAPQTIDFGAALTASDVNNMRIRITNLDDTATYSTKRADAAWEGQEVVNYTLPDNLREGDYKFKVQYGDIPIAERFFRVGPEAEAPPTITGVTASAAHVAGSGSMTHVFVRGTNFGDDPAEVTAVLVDRGLVGGAGDDLDLGTAVFVSSNRAVFRIADQENLVDGEQYDLQVTMNSGTDTESNVLSGLELLTADPAYDGKVITDVQRGASSILQFSTEELEDGVNKLNISGISLNQNTDDMRVRILDEDGRLVEVTDGLSDADTGTSAVLAVPELNAGDYIVEFANIADSEYKVIAMYPMSVANPDPSGIALHSDGTFILTGSNLGRDPSMLELEFTSQETGLEYNTGAATSIEGGRTAIFNNPNMESGDYTVVLKYDGGEIDDELTYTVITAPDTLRENAKWSVPNQYKVYEFAENLSLSSDREQPMEFRFYNTAPGEVPATSFTFRYEDPNLPYIDHVEMVTSSGVSFRISDLSETEINEQPVELLVFANDKTESMNYYIGDYPTSAYPRQVDWENDTEDGFRVFSITLEDLPNGITDITFVPNARDASADETARKSGENTAGFKSYTFAVSSTPYVMAYNIYNGMIIQRESDIACSSGATGCIEGRLVNISDEDRVRVLVNGVSYELTSVDASNRFRFDLGSSITLEEGKNTVEFIVYEDETLRTPISTSAYEIFKFSTTAPSFVSIVPVESTDIVRFVSTNVPDFYATTEMEVEFAGQFSSNASEITLTVQKINPDTGKLEEKYDRRYGSGFNRSDPSTSNPRFFGPIHSSTGKFSTNKIALSPQGDTVFKFTITNESNIAVTKTITITREPQPYVIISPTFTKNADGTDQVNVNSNYVEFEIQAENADQVLFGKVPAMKREYSDRDMERSVNRFYYEVSDLKAGKNNVKFTVIRGDEKLNASVTVFNVNTPVQGAQFKSEVKNRIKAFEDQLTLSFPRNTNLMRNDSSAVNQFITTNRQILFGIADSTDGRVDKYKHPASYDNQSGNPNDRISSTGRVMLAEQTGRFRAISPLFWIDAGTIDDEPEDVNEALNGSGRLPYDEDAFYARDPKDIVVPSQPGTLTLKYDPIVRNDGWKYVTVYHFDNFEDYRGVNGWRWRNVGGVVDPSKNTITVPFERFGYYQVKYMDRSFDDVISHGWAREYLDILYSKGVMLNKSSSNFVPNDPISRGEFATQLVKIFDIPLQYSERSSFTDVLRVNPLTNGLYDYRYIETAARAGIIRGAGGGRFQPDAAVSRQDAAVMIARAANLKLENNTDKALKDLQKEFTDANDIDVYARSAIIAVADKGFIEGKENVLLSGQKKATYRFDPSATFTRAEAAAVAIRVMQDQKKIPK